MNRLLRWIRRGFVWMGPALILLTALGGGFVYWCLGTEPGTRWTLEMATRQLDGHVQGVRGSLWAGVQAEDLAIRLPDVSVNIQNLNLQLDWHDLVNHRVHIHEVSAARLDVGLFSPADQAPAAPFKMPVLPFRVAIDRLSIGEVQLQQDKAPVPLTVRNLLTSVAVSEEGAQLVLTNVRLGHESISIDMHGEARLLDLADPWPIQARLTTHIQGQGSDSPLCARNFVPALPTGRQTSTAQAAKATTTTKEEPATKDRLPMKKATPELPIDPILKQPVAECTFDVDMIVDGSLDGFNMTVAGTGQGIRLDANANLLPRGTFPLKDAVFGLELADGSSLSGQVNWDSTTVDNAIHDHLVGSIRSEKLDIGRLVGPAIPPSVVTSSVDFDAQLLNHKDLLSADLNASFGAGSRWNKQALSGALKANIINTAARQAAGALNNSNSQAESNRQAESNSQAESPVNGPADSRALWKGLQLADLKMDLTLGKNHLAGDGSLGAPDSRLNLKVLAPQLAAFWPDLPGGMQLQGQLTGSLPRHGADLKVVYTPGDSKSGQLGAAPIDVHLNAAGAWGIDSGAPDSAEGWRGKLLELQAKHAGMSVRSQGPVALAFIPGAVPPAWQWQAGAASIEFLLPSRKGFVISHQGSRGGAGRWETQGAVDKLAISRRLIKEVQKLFDPAAKEQADRGRVKLKSDEGNDAKEVVFGANWNLKFAGALTGEAHLKRISGDIIVPGEPDFPLGLQAFTLDLTAKPAGAGASRLVADATMQTAKMGHVSATGTALLRTPEKGGWTVDSKDPKTLKLNAAIDDLSWLRLFMGDTMDVGGSLRADIQAQSRANGTWETSGTITGQKIRVIRLDEGVRLLDGTLTAHLSNNRIILDGLRFPAQLRVSPKEWRTNEWVTTNAEAKGGSLTLHGDWDLAESIGLINIDLYRYPILQRSDRYAMVTGKLAVDMQMPKIAISGDLKADAGWFDLDMLSTVPTLDSDVVIIRAGEQKKVSVPAQISLDLNVDLGPRFYITGYGLDSGLVGNLHIRMVNSKLTAEGALRTRGGAIDAYGQHLQLRRGTITFQGDITSPVLNIEALRTGVAVEAGVRVAGTAKRPRIDLVSYPDVSDVEKLSWLLLGRGPDQAGGDAALLFSVGTSFLGAGEPFYRKFGLDEVSIRSGTLGSTGSVLPVESVVSGLNAGTSTIERQFVVASKKLSSGITLSIEQALAQTGTVARASYELAKGLNAEISAGTVNGIALVYRVFFRD